MTHDDFRARLGDITENIPAEQWATEFESVRHLYPHNIKVLEAGPALSFNCFAYALNIHEWPFYQQIRRRYPNVFADPRFVTRLISDSVLVPAHDEADGVIIYFKNATPWHAGLRSGGRVVSKWGTGSVVEHALDEAPLDYGSLYQMYEKPSRARVEATFEVWAIEHSVAVDAIKRLLLRMSADTPDLRRSPVS